MDPATALFALIETLAAARPFEARAVAAETKARLEVADQRSNPYFIVYVSEEVGHPLLSSVEVRCPTAKAAGKDGLLLLGVREEAGTAVTQAAVMKRYGKEPEVRPPSPTGPETLPVYLVYEVEWGSLSFGFSRDEPERLTDVVLNAGKKR